MINTLCVLASGFCTKSVIFEEIVMKEDFNGMKYHFYSASECFCTISVRFLHQNDFSDFAIDLRNVALHCAGQTDYSYTCELVFTGTV
jgi:hypothetical protein